MFESCAWQGGLVIKGCPGSGCGSMVECGLPKPETRVRFPSPAPLISGHLHSVCRKSAGRLPCFQIFLLRRLVCRRAVQLLHELLKETSLRVGTLAGSVSTVSTFFPSLSQAWWLRWLGLLCIVVGCLVANFRLARHGTSSAARLQDVIGELRFNASCLQTINASTALELRTDTMQQTLNDDVVPTSVRAVIVKL
jgi:hypothetical protein